MGIGKLIVGIFIPLTIFGCVSTEICSVYNNVPSLKYNNHLRPIVNTKSYDLKLNGNLSMNIEIKFECNVIVFNARSVTDISGIRLQNTANHKIYTTDEYSIYENSILKISFARSIPQGSYNLNFNYNSKEKSHAVLSEWLVLTNFDDNHIDKKNNEAIRIWLRKSALGHGKYLVKNAEKLLRAFKNFTAVTYNEEKYVKLDFFVVPKSSTSKHHRGDLIYVDEELFINEDNIATDNNEKLYRTIAGMMVNQAFEGYNPSRSSKFDRYEFKLREYLVYSITDKAFPSWHLQDEYVRSLRNSIFENDYLFSHLHEYDMFDSYPSNGLVIHMLEHTAGKKFFLNSLREYLQNRTAVSNTNFITYLIEMSGDKKELLGNASTSWINAIGYPIITITRSDDNNSATVKQSRFLRNSNESSKMRYWIPLNFATQDNADFDDTTVTKWFSPEIESLEIVTPSSDKWLICNKQQFGYYRVNYDETNWKMIVHYLRSGNYHEIHVLNRAQLIDDAFVLAEFGYLNFNIAFDLARYLKAETEHVPWATFWEKMFRLFQYSSISSSRYYEPFKNMILELSGPLERKYLSDEASDGNDRMQRLNKISFIKWTCFYGSTLCNSYSLTKLKSWLVNPVNNPLLEDIRQEILCAGTRSANEETWKKLLDKYLTDGDEDILYTLMCSSNYKLLERLMTMFINDQLGKKNPWFFFMTIAQQSFIGLDAIIRFIDEKGTTISEKDNQYEIIDNMCIVIEQFINNNVQLEKYQKILTDHRRFLRFENADSYRETAFDRVQRANSVLQRIKV